MALMFLSRRKNRRSNINLSHVSPTTLAPGNLVPISFTRISTGDRLFFSPKAFVQAMPMNAPLVNGFKICLEYFFIPDRLYSRDLLLDRTGVTDHPEEVYFPVINAPHRGVDDDTQNITTSKIYLDSSKDSPLFDIVAPGSLADYMGFPVGLLPNFYDELGRRDFNALRMLGYLDVILTYYVNQQVSRIPTAHFWTKSNVVQNKYYDVSDIQDFLNYVKVHPNPAVAVDEWVGDHGAPSDRDLSLGSWQWLTSRASIFQRCLPPYYLESWLASSGYNDAEVKVDLESGGNSISFRNISAQSHVQRWLDLALAGGSRYSDYLNSEFDVSSVKHTSSPVFLGSDRQYLGSKVIYQTTGFSDPDSPLGSFAGQASGGETFRRRSYKFGENGHFMVMASLVPDVIYLRGIDPFLRELSLADVYAPALDNIAMQPLMREEVDGIPENRGVSFESGGFINVRQVSDKSTMNQALGFVPAWSQLMQNVSRAHGKLATDLKYWILTREYGSSFEPAPATLQAIENAIKSGTLSDLDSERVLAYLNSLYEFSVSAPSVSYDPYVHSERYNNVFADQSYSAQNFILTFAADMRVNREKGKVNVPTTL